MGGVIEEAASVLDYCSRFVAPRKRRSCGGEGGTGGDEFGEEVEVMVEGVTEDEGVDLEEGGEGGVFPLEEVKAFSFRGGPKGPLLLLLLCLICHCLCRLRSFTFS